MAELEKTVIASKTVLFRDSSFTHDARERGALHRSLQISELLSGSGFELKDLNATYQRNVKSFLSGVNSLIRAKKIPNGNLFRAMKCALSLGSLEEAFRQALKENPNAKGMLWESTGESNYFIPSLGAKWGIPVIAAPQNIESLVPSSKTHSYYFGKNRCRNFETEIGFLRKAQEIFTISRQEKWLLRTQGINAHYLPYYPPASLLSRLKAIRNRRKTQTSTRNFIIMGSFDNNPTVSGTRSLCQFLAGLKQKPTPKIHVIGYGTDALRESLDPSIFTVHGYVEANKLDTLLSSCTAVMIHHSDTSGVLCRLRDLLIAGIPCIVSNNACNDLHDSPGLYSYESLSSIPDLLNLKFNIPPPPPQPKVEEELFLDIVTKVASGKTSRASTRRAQRPTLAATTLADPWAHGGCDPIG